RTSARHRRRPLHLHQSPADHRGSGMSGLIESMQPQEIVHELDKYIVGQGRAKRAVAIALRNRWRRLQVAEPLRQEITPKNILLIGPTGVGKTEIARRLARLADAPFIKIEATKFTEVGYVGRDVDSMVRDLAQVAYQMAESEKTAEVRGRAEEAAMDRLLDLLHPLPRRESQQSSFLMGFGGERTAPTAEDEERQRKRIEQAERIRARLRDQLATGALDERKVEVEVEEPPPMAFTSVFSSQGMEEMGFNLQDVLG